MDEELEALLSRPATPRVVEEIAAILEAEESSDE